MAFPAKRMWIRCEMCRLSVASPNQRVCTIRRRTRRGCGWRVAAVWAVADLALSRAGASSCAELTACGVPSILMPYPFHTDMHQRANGKVLVDAGAAILVDDQKDRAKNVEKLRPAMESLLYDVPKRKAMSTAAKALGKPDAAENVAQVVKEIASSNR